MEVVLVSDQSKFYELKDDWNDLVMQTEQPNYFMTWDWLYTWWDAYFVPGMTLQIHCYYLNDKLVALFPLYLDEANQSKTTPYRCLRFLGTGEKGTEEVGTEYLDIICLSECIQEVTYLVVNELKAGRNKWRVLILGKILVSSLILNMLKNDSCNIKFRSNRTGKRYYINIEKGWDAYQQELSSKFRKSSNYYLRRVDKSHQFKHSLSGNKGDVIDDFRIIKELHEKRWESKGEQGAFGSERFKKFHCQLMKLLVVNSDLFLHKLYQEDEVIAFLYAFRFKDTMYYYQSGFNHEHVKKYSPGLVLIIKSIQSAISHNCNRYDFMMGGFKSYKQKYGCETEMMVDIEIYNQQAVGRLLYLFSLLKSLIKGIANRNIIS